MVNVVARWSAENASGVLTTRPWKAVVLWAIRYLVVFGRLPERFQDSEMALSVASVTGRPPRTFASGSRA